ncbi:MAG: YdcF family protein [Planctomycetes bacterium]|nr:YdcF family protein [Planctomycetota bacterium]
MHVVADLVKTYLVPGSISFLILAFAVGVCLLYGGDRAKRWGRRWLTVLAVLYWALSTQLVADWIAAGLTRNYRPLTSAAEAHGATAIVVLSVGSTAYIVNGQQVPELGKDTAFNVLEAARVFRLLGRPMVIASGGSDPARPRTPDSEIMRDSLVKLGVAADRIVLESRSSNTREQAVFTADLLRARGLKTVALVTAPEHMSRAVATFAALGFTVIPAVSAFKDPERRSVWERIRPSRGALLQSDWAVYEYLARAYYWLQGWA